MNGLLVHLLKHKVSPLRKLATNNAKGQKCETRQQFLDPTDPENSLKFWCWRGREKGFSVNGALRPRARLYCCGQKPNWNPFEVEMFSKSKDEDSANADEIMNGMRNEDQIITNWTCDLNLLPWALSSKAPFQLVTAIFFGHCTFCAWIYGI